MIAARYVHYALADHAANPLRDRRHEVPHGQAARRHDGGVGGDGRADDAEHSTCPATHPQSEFGHLMGGYDAGYYGYLWSKVYAQDMFSRFEAQGLTSPVAGRAYRDDILAPARLEEPDAEVRAFLGRPDEPERVLPRARHRAAGDARALSVLRRARQDAARAEPYLSPTRVYGGTARPFGRPTTMFPFLQPDRRSRCRALTPRAPPTARRGTCCATSTTRRSCGATRSCDRTSRAPTPATPRSRSTAVRGLVHASARALSPAQAARGCTARSGRMHAALLRCEIDKQPLAVVARELGLSDRQIRRERRSAHDAFIAAFAEAEGAREPHAVVRDNARFRLARASELHELGPERARARGVRRHRGERAAGAPHRGAVPRGRDRARRRTSRRRARARRARARR